jgi:hypothetical protein
MDKNIEKKNREEGVMRRFWNWMKEKGHGEWRSMIKRGVIFDVSQLRIMPTPQMTIGYMLEYIRDHEFWKEYQYSEEFRLHNTIKNIDWLNRLGLISECNNMYRELESIIKEMDSEE